MKINRVAKAQLVRFLRRMSGYVNYRRLGAFITRRNPSWLIAFTRCSIMPPMQKRDEFVSFLELLMSPRPSSLLEIGTARGGTSS